jgi:cytoskeleton protein RodZ
MVPKTQLNNKNGALWRVRLDEETAVDGEFTFQKVGEQLKVERERRGLTLDDIAGQTRVPMRHLQAIEASQYEKLPGSTYAMGFTRSYARALELDDAKIGKELRIELVENGAAGYQTNAQMYEPADPSSVPSRLFAWTAGGTALLVLIGFLIWRAYFMQGGTVTAIAPLDSAQSAITEAATEAPSAAPSQNVNAGGQVTLTAKDVVWIKIYDADNKRIFEAEMKAGDAFMIPKDANNPKILTGRPQAIAATIDGKEMPPLGEADRTISNIGVSAAAFAERAKAAGTDTPATTDAPTQGATNSQ